MLKLENAGYCAGEVLDSETGEQHGSLDRANAAVTLIPGVYDLKFAKTTWRFVKIDGGKTTTLKPAQVKIDSGIKWSKGRVTLDGQEVFRFDAVTWNATLPPGDYVVEIDDDKIPFPATEGEVLDIKPQ